MTKRKGVEEQLWLLVGEDGTVQTVKKDKLDEEEEEADEEENDLIETLDDEDPESVHNEVYIDDSQLVEEVELDLTNEENGQLSDTEANEPKVESTSNNVEDNPPGTSGTSTAPTGATVKWSEKATFRLLDLVEQVIAKELEVPAKSDRVWIRIALDMKPFFYTAEDCHRKFKALNRTYRSVLERKAQNIPFQWRYFHRMSAIVGESHPKKRTPSGLKTEPNEPRFVCPEPEPSTSADALTADEFEEVGLSRFDTLLKRKKEMLLEYKLQGDILQRHVTECIDSSIRREERENEMIKLLVDLKNQELSKLELFRKLLDKLWFV